jgi:hypothetical protein
MSTEPTHTHRDTEATTERYTEVDTQTHGTRDVLDDGDTARLVEGEATPGATREVGTDEVLDDGETSRAVDGESTRSLGGDDPVI